MMRFDTAIAIHRRFALGAHASHGCDASSNSVMLTETCGDVRSTGRRHNEHGTVLSLVGYAEVSVEEMAASA